ncbi:hypothetical protein DFH09DRAFT_1341297 [Mycena vulgaris]|nr:hypothetical protein DFH09DRAFT_1341297 [Mycena vulgaris]
MSTSDQTPRVIDRLQHREQPSLSNSRCFPTDPSYLRPQDILAIKSYEGEGNGSFSLGLLSHPDTAASDGAGVVVDAPSPDGAYSRCPMLARSAGPYHGRFDAAPDPQAVRQIPDTIVRVEDTLREEPWNALFSADTETAEVEDMFDALGRIAKVKSSWRAQERPFKEFKEMTELDGPRIEALAIRAISPPSAGWSAMTLATVIRYFAARRVHVRRSIVSALKAVGTHIRPSQKSETWAGLNCMFVSEPGHLR